MMIRRLISITLACVVAATFGMFTFAAPSPQTTGTWGELGTLVEARQGASATMLDDGRVLVAGGSNASGVLASAELVSANGSVTALSAMNTPRAGHTATKLADGRVLVAGGTIAGGKATATAEIFTPWSGTWTPVSMTTARRNHTATLLKHESGLVVIAGGENADGVLASVEVFDPAANAFGPLAATLSSPRTRQAAAALPEGRIIVIAGSTGTSVLATSDIVNGVTGTVSAGPSLTEARMNFTATDLLNGDVLVAGGVGGTNGITELGSAEKFLTAMGAFIQVNGLLGPRQGHQAVRLPNNAGVLVVGGTAFEQPLRQVDLFLPESQVFRATSPTEILHTAGALAPIGTGLAVSAGGAGTAAVETYAFATVTTDTDDYAPGETVYMSGSGWNPNEPVTLVLREVGQLHPDRTFYALANGRGDFENAEFSPEPHHLGVRFYLTATQGTSEAQTTFTDDTNKATLSTTATGDEISSFTGVASGVCVNAFLQARQGSKLDTVFSPRTATLSSSPSGATFYAGANCATSTASVAIPTDESSVPFSFRIDAASTATYTINATSAWVSGSGSNQASATIQVTAGAAPAVVSIARASSSPTYASSVDWTVTFSESVNGVNTGDFQLFASGISGASITNVTGSGTSWTVTTDTGVGTGSLGLNLIDDDTIVDADGSTLGGPGLGNGNATGEIYSINRTLTPAFTADDKVYDGNNVATILTRSFTTPVVGVDVELAGGTATFSNRNVGNAKTVTATGFFLDGDDAIRFLLSSTTATATANITEANPVCTITGYDVTYDATPHTATGSCVGVEGETLAGLSLTGTTHTNAGSYPADTWSFIDDTGNYQDKSGTVANTIAKASSTTTVVCSAGPFTFNGSAHEPCAVSVTGVGGLNLTPAPVYANNTDAGQATASYTFAGDNNHDGSNDSETFTIGKASSTTAVTCAAGPFTFNGSAHEPCSVSVTGVGGLNLTPAPVYANNTDAGQATASYTFAGDNNHDGSNDSETFTIGKASSTTTVSCAAGPFTFNGSAHEPCSVSVTGVGGLNLTPAPVYANNTDAGQATASYTFSGDNNHDGSNDSETFTIAKASSTTTVICAAGPFTFNGLAQEPCSVSVTGVGGLNLTPAPVYANNTDAGQATASYTFAGDNNHDGSNDSESFTIGKASSVTSISCPGGPFIYNGSAQTPCVVSVTGVGGLNLTPAAAVYANNTNAGTATASYSYLGDSNHTGSNDSEDFIIEKKSASVAAHNMSKIFGAVMTPDESMPGDFGVTGLVGNDSVSAVTLTSSGYAVAAAPGSHAIKPSNATGTGLANYNISYTNATLSVTFATGVCQGEPGRTILNPINPDGSSVFKQKSTVPAKFRVCDANGNSVGLPGTVIGFAIIMSTNGTYSDANEAPDSTTPDTAFRWSATDRLWIFNISTKTLTANKTYLFRISLADGTFIDFGFGLK